MSPLRNCLPLAALTIIVLLTTTACESGGVGSGNQNNNNEPVTQVASLDALAGNWQIESMTTPAASGGGTWSRVEAMVDHDGTLRPTMLRGWMDLSNSSNTTGTLDITLGVVVEGRLSETDLIDNTITLEDDRLVITDEEQSDFVVTYVLAGDTLTLTVDAEDPRNSSDGGPELIVLKRRTLADHALSGDWRVTSYSGSEGSQTMTATDGCTEMGPGEYIKIGGSIVMDRRGWFDGLLTDALFDNDSCSGNPIEESSTPLDGFFDLDENANTLFTYLQAEGEPGHPSAMGADYTYAFDGANLILTVTDWRGESDDRFTLTQFVLAPAQ